MMCCLIFTERFLFDLHISEMIYKCPIYWTHMPVLHRKVDECYTKGLIYAPHGITQ